MVLKEFYIGKVRAVYKQNFTVYLLQCGTIHLKHNGLRIAFICPTTNNILAFYDICLILYLMSQTALALSRIDGNINILTEIKTNLHVTIWAVSSILI